jgi:hypothetical protein
MEGTVQHETTLATIAGAHPDTLLEITVRSGDTDEQHLKLRRLSWGEGVGWYRQQTLQLDASEAEELLLALRKNRSQWRKHPQESHGTVIPFPARTALQDKQERKTA